MGEGPASTPNTRLSLWLAPGGSAQTTSTLTRPYASRETRAGSGHTLGGALLGFVVITLDAVIVNIALPSIRHDFGGGITGLQWVVDGYTPMFAALLLSAGALF